MNRSKKVQHITLTIYKDFTENGINYRGSSTTEVHSTLSDQELCKLIGDTAFAASLVKNEYYPLVTPSDSVKEVSISNFAERPMSEWMPMLAEAVFKADVHEKGWINSAEFFLNKIEKRIVNSQGVDVSFSKYKGQVEFITNWKESSEEIELYKNIDFSDYKPEVITQAVEDMLTLSKSKALAQNTPALKKSTVLLTREPVQDFFSYYYDQSSASAVYNKMSVFKAGDRVQGDNVEGDYVNIVLDPKLENSTVSVPYDNDGFPLKKVDLYSDGVINGLWGNKRFSHYVKAESTGDIGNIVISGGTRSLVAMQQEPHLELAAFSDFQMDSLTGDFAGEIRLGWYFDGTTRIPVTGGSISGNIKDVQKKMFLSQETEQNNNYVVPKAVQLFNVSVAGIEE
jgi:PmbA protein